MDTVPSIPDAYWSIDPDTLKSHLQVSTAGLTQEEAARRLELYGPNSIQVKKRSSTFLMFLNQFKSPIMLILIFATLISAIVQDWVDALIILIIILASATLSFVQEYNAGTAAEKLKQQVTFKSSCPTRWNKGIRSS